MFRHGHTEAVSPRRTPRAVDAAGESDQPVRVGSIASRAEVMW